MTTKGFTLIELLIVIALIVLIMAMAMPVSLEFFEEQRIEEEGIFLANHLKTAQARAIAGQNNSSWGIRINQPISGQYTLFRGDSYVARDQTYDEVFRLSVGATATGTEEIVFEKLTGRLIIR